MNKWSIELTRALYNLRLLRYSEIIKIKCTTYELYIRYSRCIANDELRYLTCFAYTFSHICGDIDDINIFWYNLFKDNYELMNQVNDLTVSLAIHQKLKEFRLLYDNYERSYMLTEVRILRYIMC